MAGQAVQGWAVAAPQRPGEGVDVQQVVDLANQYLRQDPRQLAAGDPKSEFAARFAAAAMVLGVNPIQARQQYFTEAL